MSAAYLYDGIRVVRMGIGVGQGMAVVLEA